MTTFLASVVIVVREDLRVLRTVQALLPQAKEIGSCEVIVVENGSALLRDLLPKGVVYEWLSGGNMARARNKGLSLSKGRFILFTDADCVPAEGWVREMISSLVDGEFGGVGGAIDRFEPRTIVQRYGSNLVNGQRELNYLPITPLPYVAGANSGFCRNALLDAGGFDEQLLSGNDVDVCYKLGLLGYQLTLNPRALVLHDNCSNVSAHFCRFFRYAVYQVLLWKKYKNHTSKAYLVNPYPWKLFARAACEAPRAIVDMATGKMAGVYELSLLAVEGLGVLLGDIAGALRFRQLYL